MTAKKLFFKYVPQNILGMVGLSLYVLADTFFIAQKTGSDGITALNLVLPVYSFIFAIGQMIGVGSAIRFSIAAARESDDKDHYFFNAVFWGTVIGLVFAAVGFFMPDKVISIMGGDSDIIKVGETYTRIFMSFAPFFICNGICGAFVRNDGSPSVAMAATLGSSFFNIVMDYVFMYPLNMGMPGAALATALAPVVGILICLVHLLSKKCTIAFHVHKPSIVRLFRSCQLGVSAFVGEISSGVTTAAFNGIILKLAGNIGVAAYGVIANASIVAVSVFNGIAQGCQPIISRFYGEGDKSSTRKVVKMGIVTAILIAVTMIVCVFFFNSQIVGIFNSEHDRQLAVYAERGIRIYFAGFIFAGINIVGAGLLSAMEQARGAFIVSISRGFVSILVFAFLLSALFGLDGVWAAFPTAEFVTLLLLLPNMKRKTNNSEPKLRSA